MKHWTVKEDAIVIEEITLHPGNISTAFALASKRLERSEGAIKQRWYRVLSKETKEPVYAVFGTRKYSVNRKNFDNTPHQNTTIFKKIKKWLGWIKK